jgi:ABC-type oligopeptide transport system substrate-binding subunit
MKKTRSFFLFSALALVVICPLLTGCGQGTNSTMSKEDEKNFKGGQPMPPEAIKAMQGAGAPPAGPSQAAAPTKP